MRTTLLVERAGHAAVQDLGRPGLAGIGVTANGALDQHAARTANILVGNTEAAALVEVTGSELVLVAENAVLLAVTGAAERVVVDGHAQPAWETLSVPAGSRVVVPVPARGFRSYVAVRGTVRAQRVLGSVAPDPLLGLDTRLAGGDRITVDTSYDGPGPGELGALWRMGVARPRLPGVLTVQVTEGPDLGRTVRGRDALADTFRLLPQSDHVGLRLEGPPVELSSTSEIVSRGVPIGAVEAPPTGGIIVLLRGRLVTAGYPVVAVVTTGSLDLLAQARPGDRVRFELVDVPTAHAVLRARAAERAVLAERVRTAFDAKGLAARPSAAGRGHDRVVEARRRS